MKNNQNLDWITHNLTQLEWISTYIGSKRGEATAEAMYRLMTKIHELRGGGANRTQETKRLLTALASQPDNFGKTLIGKMHNAWKVQASRLKLRQEGRQKVEIHLPKKDVRELNNRAKAQEMTTKALIEKVITEGNQSHRDEHNRLKNENKELRSSNRELKQLARGLQSKIKKLEDELKITKSEQQERPAPNKIDIANTGAYLVGLTELLTDEEARNKVAESVSIKMQTTRNLEDIMRNCYIAVTSEK